jgi:hypothetical protein
MSMCDVPPTTAADDSKELLKLCRTGKLYDMERWIAEGKTLEIPHAKTRVLGKEERRNTDTKAAVVATARQPKRAAGKHLSPLESRLPSRWTRTSDLRIMRTLEGLAAF